MRENKGPLARDLLGWVIDRRQILIKLGAFAITSPALASCGEDDGTTDDPSSGSTGSAGGAGGGTGSASSSASASGSASASSSSAGTGGVGEGGAGMGVAGGDDSLNLDPSIFEDAGRCALTTTDIEGPFFIDDSEIPNDISLFRSDIRDGHPGCELQLYFRLLDAEDGCQPIPDAEVYIWHCDADGYYSGFDGQDPSTPYSGPGERTVENDERFCRGVQLSDRNGVVGFRTIWPGWYAGRPVHVHLVARLNGATTRLITTQFYFDAELSRKIYESEPAYTARSTNIPQSSLNPPGFGNPAMPTMAYTPGLVIGKLNVIVNG
ncbi:protocatechuate 3,4-dioxygenase [Sorangium sp. So ce260]|uniref:dioxygenase family protein n=1 Tax=Sorangium sp. So ce260 TaxID=3133291 RepID=UPI003F620E41